MRKRNSNKKKFLIGGEIIAAILFATLAYQIFISFFGQEPITPEPPMMSSGTASTVSVDVNTGTPAFSINNPDGRGNYHFETDDNTVIYDSIRVRNLDTSRKITINLSGSLNSIIKNGGWFAFENNRVTLPPKTDIEIPFSISVPDGVCEGEYRAYIIGKLSDYGNSEAKVAVAFSVAERISLDIKSGLQCTEEEKKKIPGLEEESVWIAPPSPILPADAGSSLRNNPDTETRSVGPLLKIVLEVIEKMSLK